MSESFIFNWNNSASGKVIERMEWSGIRSINLKRVGYSLRYSFPLHSIIYYWETINLLSFRKWRMNEEGGIEAKLMFRFIHSLRFIPQTNECLNDERNSCSHWLWVIAFAISHSFRHLIWFLSFHSHHFKQIIQFHSLTAANWELIDEVIEEWMELICFIIIPFIWLRIEWKWNSVNQLNGL